MNFLFLLNILIFIAIGSIVYIQKKDNLSVAFFIINIGLAGWNTCSLLLEKYLTLFPVNTVSQLQLISGLIIANGFFYFGYIYPLQHKKIPYKINSIIILTFIALILFSDFVTKAVIINNQVKFIDDIGYTLYSIYLIILGISSLYFYIFSYIKHKQYRNRTIYLIFGIGLFTINAILFCLILPIFNIYNFLFLGYLSALIPSIFFSYAITKKELLDVTVIIKRTTAWIIVFTCIITSLILIQSYVASTENIQFLMICLATIIWAYIAKPFQNFLITTATRKFVKGWYDPSKILDILSEKLTTEQNRQTIFKTIVDIINQEMEFEQFITIIANRNNNNTLSEYLIYSNKSITPKKLTTKDPLITFFSSNNKLTSLNNCPEHIKTYLAPYNLTEDESILLPFFSPEILEGIIILGERSKQVGLNSEDIAFFKRLINFISGILYRLTPFELLEKLYFDQKQKNHQSQIMELQQNQTNLFLKSIQQYNHELKTPLQGLLTRTQLLPDSIKDKKKMLQLIDRANDIVSSTLKLTPNSIEKTTETPCNIHDILNKSLNLYDFKNIKTINKDIETKPTTISANKNDLISIFLNLIQNADEASNTNGELFISTAVLNSEIMIKIIDSGKGIPEKDLKWIWDPFRSGNQTSDRGLGRGFGLTIVHDRIIKHHGRVEVESEVNKGTTFTIFLPLSH